EEELVNWSREVERLSGTQHVLDRTEDDFEHEAGENEADQGRHAPCDQRNDQDATQLLEVLDDGHTSLLIRSNDRWLGHDWRWWRRGLRRPWCRSATLRRSPGGQPPVRYPLGLAKRPA